MIRVACGARLSIRCTLRRIRIPGLHRNNGQQVWRYKEQLRLRRKVPCGTLRPPIGFDDDNGAIRSTAVDRCFVCQNSVHSQSQAKAGVGRGFHFPLRFRRRKLAPHNGRIGSAFEAMPFLRRARDQLRKRRMHAPSRPSPESAGSGRGGPCERILGQKFYVSAPEDVIRNKPRRPPTGRRCGQLSCHRVARAIQICGVVSVNISRRPISSC
jgi:hypothetical protein